MHCSYPCVLNAVGRWLAGAALGFALLGGCAAKPDPADGELSFVDQPTPPVYTEELQPDTVRYAAAMRPAGQQLRSWRELAPAVSRSLAYAEKRDGEAIAVAHGEISVTWAEVRRTLALLRDVLPRLDAEPELLGRYFRWLRLTQGTDFSGYYEPLIKASLQRSGVFRHPLYARPDDLQTLNLGNFENRFIGQRIMYRLEKGQAVPYYSREEIEQGSLRGRARVLAYVADPLDAYFLHIQGSGRLDLSDGREQPILFAATNGRPYTGLGRMLVDRGELIPPTSYEAVRGWLEQHPEEAGSLMRHNERYVFFRFAEEGPVGGMGHLLTPWVSLAADPNLIPLGMPVAFTVEAPFPAGPATLHGLGLVQDTGGSVKGRLLDLFCGSGPQAEYTAGRLNTSGAAWMLVAR